MKVQQNFGTYVIVSRYYSSNQNQEEKEEKKIDLNGKRLLILEIFYCKYFFFKHQRFYMKLANLKNSFEFDPNYT